MTSRHLLTPFWRQAWVVTGVLLNIACSGFQFGYTACLLNALQQADSPIKLDASTSSWLASCIGPSTLIGYFMSSSLMAWFGRKMAFALCSIPGVLCWLIIYLAEDLPLMMLGRILGGVCTGGTVLLGAIVIGEYTSPKHRGMFLNLKTTAILCGSMILHICVNYLHWRHIALFSLSVQVIALVNTLTWPESPHWLISKNRKEECERAFVWLRGTDQKANRELRDMIKTHAKRGTKQNRKMLEHITSFCRTFTKINFLKPAAIVTFGFILLESSGRHFFPAYAQQIMEDITGDSINAFVYTLSMDVTITASSFFASILVKMLRRRTLLFSTGFAATGVLLIACLWIFLQKIQVFPSGYSGVSITLFVVYFVLSNLGSTPIPLAILGEIFPLEHRAAGSAVTGIIASFHLWVAMKATPYLLAVTHVYGTFGVYSSLQVIGLIVLYFILPETKDRTLGEIENYVRSGYYNDDGEDSDEENTLNRDDKTNVGNRDEK